MPIILCELVGFEKRYLKAVAACLFPTNASHLNLIQQVESNASSARLLFNRFLTPPRLCLLFRVYPNNFRKCLLIIFP